MISLLDGWLGEQRTAHRLLYGSKERFPRAFVLRFFGVGILPVRTCLGGSFELNLKRLKLELLTYCCLILEHLIEFKEMFLLVSIIIRWEQLLISLASRLLVYRIIIVPFYTSGRRRGELN